MTDYSRTWRDERQPIRLYSRRDRDRLLRGLISAVLIYVLIGATAYGCTALWASFEMVG